MNRILLSSAFAALVAAPASAQIVNGDFASGLAGWSVSGDATVRDGSAFITNAAFSADDDDLGPGFFNVSGAEPAIVDDLELSLGLGSGALSPGLGDGIFALEGSALTQSITVQAGDVISFGWSFLSNEAAGPDYAFVVIDGAVFNLVNGLTLSAGSSYDYSFTTGAQTFTSAPFASSATLVFGFGVVDVDSFTGSSALLVGNVSVIPEPSAFAALAGLGALGLAATRRRRRA